MERIARHLRSFAADEQGATVIEYCLIASFISLAILTGATLIGQKVVGFFQSASAGLN